MDKEERLTTINNIISKINNLLQDAVNLNACELCLYNNDNDRDIFCVTCPFIFNGTINWKKDK